MKRTGWTTTMAALAAATTWVAQALVGAADVRIIDAVRATELAA